MTRLPIGGFGIFAACFVLALAGCAGRGGPGGNANRPLPPISETEENIKLMLSYDENSDGTVTRDNSKRGCAGNMRQPISTMTAQSTFARCRPRTIAAFAPSVPRPHP